MFTATWTAEAREQYDKLKSAAMEATGGKRKSPKQLAHFKQVNKAIRLLLDNPRHPGLQTHEYHSLAHPYRKGEKVFAAYAQQNMPSAYRVSWCYGPEKGQITLLAITPHP